MKALGYSLEAVKGRTLQTPKQVYQNQMKSQMQNVNKNPTRTSSRPPLVQGRQYKTAKHQVAASSLTLIKACPQCLQGRRGRATRSEGWGVFAQGALVLLPPPPTSHAAVLSKAPNNLGLVGYWSMNEGVGTKVGDSNMVE